MARYLIAPKAQKSLKQIARYTEENYGIDQRKQYLTTLRDRMRDLATNPRLGIERPEIKAGYYSLFVEKHTLYYRVIDTHIEIIDVLHQSMEPKRHL